MKKKAKKMESCACPGGCGYAPIAYLIARVLVGVMFFAHGAGKFGWFTKVPEGLMLAAGIIEIVVGVTVAFGVIARYSAMLGGATMIAAYAISHFPRGWNPMENGGELALMYLAAFLIIAIKGNGKLSIEKAVLGKEL